DARALAVRVDGVQGAVAVPGLRGALRPPEDAVGGMTTSTQEQVGRAHAAFHPLRVADVEQLTADAVAVTFDVPPELAADYVFAPGQHLTLRAVVDGEEVRRSYSLCSPP